MSIKEESVMFVVKEPVQLDEASTITLKPGRYAGRRTQIGLPMVAGQVSLTAPEYWLDLSAEQQQEMDTAATEHSAGLELGVSGHVERGELEVEG